MTKIALIGYGRMGKIIEQTALSNGHEIVSKIDPFCEGCAKEITEQNLNGAEVCIEFTTPKTAIENITKLAELKKNIVVGTTGWYSEMDKVKAITEKNGIGLIWSGNFSIGVNAFFKIVEDTSKIFNNLPEYDVFAIEEHHKGKADSPSGTAKMIADRIIANLDRKEKIVTEKLDRKIEENELHIASVRGGSIPGTHTVTFDSAVDTIELKHTARGREGFATGAIKAAEFLNGKKGFYNIDDLMKNVIGGK